jgi:peptidoglycan hydrolase CwlO-like protein
MTRTLAASTVIAIVAAFFALYGALGTNSNRDEIGSLQWDVSSNRQEIESLQWDVSSNRDGIRSLQWEADSNRDEIESLRWDVEEIQSALGR